MTAPKHIKKDSVNITSDDIATIRSIFTTVGETTDGDVNIIFTKEKMTIRSMSNDRTLVTLAFLIKSAFINYEIKLPKTDDDQKINDINIWISIDQINKCLNGMDTDSTTLTFQIKESNDNTMYLIMQHKTITSRQEIYPIPTNDIEDDIPQIPKMSPDYEIKINSNTLKQVCTKAKKFSDSIIIDCSADKLIFEFESNQTSKKPIYIVYESSDNGEVEIVRHKKKSTNDDDDDDDLTIKNKYTLTNLLRLKNCVANKLSIALKDKFPLFAVYAIADKSGKNKIGQILTFMAQSEEHDFNDYYSITDKLTGERGAVMKKN